MSVADGGGDREGTGGAAGLQDGKAAFPLEVQGQVQVSRKALQDSQLSWEPHPKSWGVCLEKSDLESTVPVWLVCPTAKGDSDSDTQMSTPKAPAPAGPKREARVS